MADSSPLDSSMSNSSPPDSSPLDSCKPDSSPSPSDPKRPFLFKIMSQFPLISEGCPGCSSSYPELNPLMPGPPPLGGKVQLSIDRIKAEYPSDYQTILGICKLGLTHYQESHPENCYELFDSVYEVFVSGGQEIEYYVKFRAKNMKDDCNPVEAFKAVGGLKRGELQVRECVLLE